MQRRWEKIGKLLPDRRKRLLKVLPLPVWVRKQPDSAPRHTLQVGASVSQDREINFAVNYVKLNSESGGQRSKAGGLSLAVECQIRVVLIQPG